MLGLGMISGAARFRFSAFSFCLFNYFYFFIVLLGVVANIPILNQYTNYESRIDIRIFVFNSYIRDYSF